MDILDNLVHPDLRDAKWLLVEAYPNDNGETTLVLCAPMGDDQLAKLTVEAKSIESFIAQSNNTVPE